MSWYEAVLFKPDLDAVVELLHLDGDALEVEEPFDAEACIAKWYERERK